MLTRACFLMKIQLRLSPAVCPPFFSCIGIVVLCVILCLSNAYIGQVITKEPDQEIEIFRRIKMGWITVGNHSQNISGNLPLALNWKVYNSCILPILTYRAATWRLMKSAGLLLITTERAIERKMRSTTLKDKKRGEWVRKQTGVKDIAVEINKKNWTWAGHAARRQANFWSFSVAEGITRARKPMKRKQS